MSVAGGGTGWERVLPESSPGDLGWGHNTQAEPQGRTQPGACAVWLAVAPAGVSSWWLDREGPARPLDGVVTALRPRRSPSWAESSKVARHALSPSAPPRGRPEPQAPDAGLRARISPSLSHRAERGPSPLSALCCGQQPHVGGLGRSAPCAPLGPGVPQPGARLFCPPWGCSGLPSSTLPVSPRTLGGLGAFGRSPGQGRRGARGPAGDRSPTALHRPRGARGKRPGTLRRPPPRTLLGMQQAASCERNVSLNFYLHQHYQVRILKPPLTQSGQ